jgi:thiamine pyrophosphate-dependent acetolactate synthase large subunit-like protein
MMQCTGAQALLAALMPEEVKFVFGVAGGKLARFMHALSGEPRVRYVGVRHEAAGAWMAAGSQCASGRMAVAMGEMAPGAANLLSGAGTAFNNSLPMLLLTSNQHRAAAYPHSGMFMDMDTHAAFGALTKWHAVVNDGRRIPELVRTAFREAHGGRPGPVHLDVMQDVFGTTCDFAEGEFDLQPRHYRAIHRPRADATLIEQAAALLREAKRPLILAGGGVVASGASASLMQLAGALNAPAIPTQMALGTVPSGSAHFIGHGGLIGGEAVLQALAQADVVLAVGCRFSSWLWDDKGPMVKPPQKLININIDYRALGAPARHEIGIQADAKSALDDLIAAMPRASKSASQGDWLAGLRSTREAYRRKLDAMGAGAGDVMHPAVLARRISEHLPQDAMAAYDGGHTSFWSNDFNAVNSPRSHFHDPGMAHLGFGLPFALGLKLAHPGRPVFNITGDGAFGFTLSELDTARRYGLPVINIIHNNASWGIIKAGQKASLKFSLGADLEDTRYADIARGFGCHGEAVTEAAEVGPAIRRALASGLPAVLDCRTRFEPHPALPAFGRMNAFGFPQVEKS